MNDLIRRSDVLSKAYTETDYNPETFEEVEFEVVDIADINSIPAVDAVEVVRCDACDWHVDVGYHYCNKWCEPCPDNADFFCAYGERSNCGADMREE